MSIKDEDAAQARWQTVNVGDRDVLAAAAN
jgi:hypothetical protein